MSGFRDSRLAALKAKIAALEAGGRADSESLPFGAGAIDDRVAGKVGSEVIHRYLPAKRYWPERAVLRARSVTEKPASNWRVEKPRPTELLKRPDPIEVMALIPDHPPKFFIYKGVRHQVIKADGPERIEREWWLDTGEHRDYYQVEDDQGGRYWLFRSGHYGGEQKYQWFIHGFFA